MIDPFVFPTKRPTREEYAVIVVASSVLCIAVGIVALVVAFQAPSEKHDLAVALAQRGGWSIAIGVGIGFAYWLFRRFKNSAG